MPSRPIAAAPPGDASLARALLDWYGAHARALPWRVPPGSAERPDPYRTWVSEVMLQQTGVKVVVPRFERFVARWPGVAELAAAGVDEVTDEWAGLGYYSRARNLHACARVVAEEHWGRFPATRDALRALPGLGDYTAGRRRGHRLRRAGAGGGRQRGAPRLAPRRPAPVRRGRPRGRSAKRWPGGCPPSGRGDFALATMDLGATICTPRAPACLHCPVRPHCRAAAEGDPARYPVRAPKRARPSRTGAAFVARRADGATWARAPPAARPARRHGERAHDGVVLAW